MKKKPLSNDEVMQILFPDTNKTISSKKEDNPSQPESFADEPIFLMESNDGMLMRVPASKLEQWQAAQQEGDRELTEEEQRLKEKMLSGFRSKKGDSPLSEDNSYHNHAPNVNINTVPASKEPPLSFADVLKSVLSSVLGQIVFFSVRIVIFLLVALLLYLLSSVPIISNIVNWFFVSSKSTPTLATLYISTALAYFFAKLTIQKLRSTTNLRRISLSLLGLFTTTIHILSLIVNIFFHGSGDYRINIACIIAGLCFCFANPDK